MGQYYMHSHKQTSISFRVKCHIYSQSYPSCMHMIGLQFSLGGYFVVVANEMLMAILNTVHLTLFSINSVAFIA